MKIFLKNFFKQNNNITLTFNLKTLECKIIYAAKELFDYTNTDFYELFPNQIKEQLIKIFFNIVLNSKENRKAKNYYKNIKQKRNKYIEPTLLIKTNIDNFNYYRKLSLKLALLFHDFMSEKVLLYGSFYINENIVVTIHNKNSKEKIIGYGNQDIMNIVFQCKLNFIKFKESTFMKDKIIQNSYSFSVNDNTFFIYNILEIEKKKKKMNKSDINKTQSKSKERNKSVEDEKISANTSFIEENEEDTENVNEENTINNKKSKLFL